MLFHRWLLFAVLVMSSHSCFAEKNWADTFLKVRREMFGDLSELSTDEVSRFYALDGKRSALYPALADVLTDEEDLEEPLNFQPPPIPKTKPKSIRTTRRKKERTKTKSDDKWKALPQKARQAYSAGQLEEARKLYKIVEKLDPDSREARERLYEIERELR